MAITDDASFYLADFGVPVTAGASSGLGILDQNSEMLLGDQVVSVDYALTCEASLFGRLDYGGLITVAGNVYEVRHQPMLTGDGMFCIVPLAMLQRSGKNITTISGLRLVTQDGRSLTTFAA